MRVVLNLGIVDNELLIHNKDKSDINKIRRDTNKTLIWNWEKYNNHVIPNRYMVNCQKGRKETGGWISCPRS
jgi:hypothetical protein